MSKIKIEYGSMSSLFSCEADNKLTCYAVMCLHYQEKANMIAIYTEEYKEDSWLNLIDGKIADRLDEIFGGKDAFDKYLENNIDKVKACYKSIVRLS
jgi:hypothetical protein